MRSRKLTSIHLVVFLILGVFQNCAKIAVDDAQGVESGVEVVPGDSGGTLPDDEIPVEGELPVVTPPSSQLRLYTKINVCAPHSNCIVDYYLTEAMSERLEFSWQTNDTKYLENVQKYARPGTHYVSGSGVVVFRSGETHQQITIKSLSGFTVGMEIPFLWDNCVYGGESVDCRSILLN